METANSSGSWLCSSAWSWKSDPLIISAVTVFCAKWPCLCFVSHHVHALVGAATTLLRLFQKAEVVLFRQRPRVCLSLCLCVYSCLCQYFCDRSVLRDRWSKSRTGVSVTFPCSISNLLCLSFNPLIDSWILLFAVSESVSNCVVPPRSCPERTVFQCLHEDQSRTPSHIVSRENV